MDIFADLIINNKVNKNAENWNPIPAEKPEATFSRSEKVEINTAKNVVFGNHDDFNIGYDSDFGKLSYNFLDGKLWMSEHGCTFTDEEILNLGPGRISMIELSLKKMFNARVAGITPKEEKMLNEIMVAG